MTDPVAARFGGGGKWRSDGGRSQMTRYVCSLGAWLEGSGIRVAPSENGLDSAFGLGLPARRVSRCARKVCVFSSASGFFLSSKKEFVFEEEKTVRWEILLCAVLSDEAPGRASATESAARRRTQV